MWGIAACVVVANTVNLGADLGAMADVTGRIAGGPRRLHVVALGTVCAGLLVALSYERYVRTVKWASLSLLAYIFSAGSLDVPWGHALWQTVLPALPTRAGNMGIVVAVLGTTISPYLFVWQSSLEAERARGLPVLAGPGAARPDATGLARAEARRIRLDTCTGMAIAGLVAYAVVVTAAASLHARGIKNLGSLAQAASTLRPAMGPLADAAFSLGILGTGLLAVPMLAGSAAFAVAEGAGRPAGLSMPAHRARTFNLCILAAVLAGIGMDFAGIDPIRALILSGLLNGLLSVPLLGMMMLVARRTATMGRLAVSRPLAILGWLATALMAVAAVGLLVTLDW
jgi:Mn2+/Fe2+ NRAMP family transporter